MFLLFCFSSSHSGDLSSCQLQLFMGFPGGSDGKESTCSAVTCVQSLGQEDPPEKGMASHFSILAWRIPWSEEPGGLQSMVSQRVMMT